MHLPLQRTEGFETQHLQLQITAVCGNTLIFLCISLQTWTQQRALLYYGIQLFTRVAHIIII